MATKTTYGPLNPDNPDVGPGVYNRMFSSIETPNYPSALAVSLKGAGGLLDASVKAADTIIKSSYKEEVDKAIDPEKEKWIEGLKYAQNKVAEINAPKVVPTDTGPVYGPTQEQAGFVTTGPNNEPMSLVTPPQDAPKDIKDLPVRLRTLESARGGGIIDDLDFRGRIHQIAKEIRSRYPVGYRNEIDLYVDQVVKAGPANEYATALMRRINSSLTNADREYFAMLGELRNNLKYPGIAQAYEQLLNRQIDIPEAGRRLSNQKAIEYDLDIRKKRTETFQAETGVVKDEYARYANDSAYSRVRSQVQGTIDSTGMKFEDLHNLAVRAQQGDQTLKKMPSEWWAKMGASVDAMILRASKEMDEDWATPDKAGRTVAYMVPAKQLAEIKEASLTTLKQLREAFTKEDLNLAGQAALWAKMATQDLNFKILNDKQIGGSFLMMSALKERGGDMAVNQFMIRAAQTGKLNEWDMFVKRQILQLATPDGDPRFAKDISSLKGAIEKLNSVQKEHGIKSPKDFQELTSIIDAPRGISLLSKDATFEMKREIAKKIYGPGNENVLRLIDPDMRDQRGNRIPGMESLFYRNTQPDIVNTVKQLGPDIVEMYRDWVIRTYEQDVAKTTLSKFATANLSAEGKWEVAWDPKDKKFVVNVEGVDMNKPVTAFDAYRRFKGLNLPFQLLEDAVQDMNKGLRGMKSVAENLGLQGEAVDVFMLQPLMDAGLANERLMQMKGIPYGMANAIWNSYIAAKQKEIDEAKQKEELKKSYTPPERR